MTPDLEVTITGSRLSPLDATFLAVETPSAHMHLGFALACDPPVNRPPPTFIAIRHRIGSRLHLAPRFRKRIRPVPLGLNAPIWVDDDEFDLSRHIMRARSRRLDEVVAECLSEPLAHDRPLWQLRVADRLDGGRVGIVGKLHHCMVDGSGVVELGSLLLDLDPDATPERAKEWTPEPGPGPAGLLAAGLADLAREQLRMARSAAGAARSPRRAVALAGGAPAAAQALFDAVRPARPVPPINQPISPRRHVGFATRPLEDLLRVKREFGVKLNDVVLAVSAGALRRFVAERGRVPEPLKAMVPVNVRRPDEAGQPGNRLSFMFVELPCDEPDPVLRLRRIHAAVAERKRSGRAEGAERILRVAALAPALLQRMLTRVVASSRAFNLVVSSLPGPNVSLYVCGAELVELYPVAPLVGEHALSIAMTTARDLACFGLYADRDAIPDVDRLVVALKEEIGALVDLAERRVGPPHGTIPAG